MVTVKAKIKTATLLEAVAKAALWTVRNSPLQALQCIRFTCTDKKLELSAMDGSTTDISLYLDIESDGDFDVCIPADRLLAKLLILARSSEWVNISIGKAITIKTEKHTSRIVPVDVGLFPGVDRSFDVSGGIQISTDEFSNAIKKTMAAADPNSPYPALEGILLNGKEVVSVDGTRISIYSKSKFSNGNVLVHATSLAKIAKAIDTVDEINILHTKNKFIVFWDDGIVTSTTIGHEFPDYKQIIPKEYETVFTLPMKDLHDAIGLSAAEALESQNLVMIDAVKEVVTIKAKSESGWQSSEIEPDGFEGPNKKFGISIKYLKDAVSKLGGEFVTFGVNSTSGLIMLYNDDYYRYGIMPMYAKET